MTHQRAIEALRHQYFWLDSHFDDLYALCATSAEKSSLRAAYVGCRDNFRDARARIFIDHDPTGALLLSDLQSAMDRVQALTASGFQEGLLDLVAASVSVGSRLVGCGSTAA